MQRILDILTNEKDICNDGDVVPSANSENIGDRICAKLGSRKEKRKYEEIETYNQKETDQISGVHTKERLLNNLTFTV